MNYGIIFGGFLFQLSPLTYLCGTSKLVEVSILSHESISDIIDQTKFDLGCMKLQLHPTWSNFKVKSINAKK